MTGIVFFRTADRERVVEFYVDRLGARRWLEQDGRCTILRLDNLLVGFCSGDGTAVEAETDGIVTVAVEDEAAVDRLYGDLDDVARGPPERVDAFDIYRFFATDPDGRTVEVQTFLHELPETP